VQDNFSDEALYKRWSPILCELQTETNVETECSIQKVWNISMNHRGFIAWQVPREKMLNFCFIDNSEHS